MKTLEGLKARFAHIQAPERTVRNALSQAISEIIGIEFTGTAKLSQENTVYIQAPAPVKARIFEQQYAILNRANNILGKKQLKHLR